MLIFGLWPCVSTNMHCQLNPAIRACLRNTKFRSKTQETLMVPMLLWQTGLQPPASSVFCLGKSPCREKPLSTDLCWARKLSAGQQAWNVPVWCKRRRPVWWSNNYFNYFIITPRQVCNFTPSARATNCRPCQTELHALLSSQPGRNPAAAMNLPSCQCNDVWRQHEGRDLGEAGSREAALRFQDSCKVLGFGYIIGTSVCSRSFFVPLLFSITKKPQTNKKTHNKIQ